VRSVEDCKEERRSFGFERNVCGLIQDPTGVIFDERLYVLIRFHNLDVVGR
jgi:hypothetical protein